MNLKVHLKLKVYAQLSRRQTSPSNSSRGLAALPSRTCSARKAALPSPGSSTQPENLDYPILMRLALTITVLTTIVDTLTILYSK